MLSNINKRKDMEPSDDCKQMYVIKRSGKKELMHFDKISARLSKLNYNLKSTDPSLVTQKVCSHIHTGIKTSEVDELASQVCMNLVTTSPEYGTLGGRIVVSNHHKNTSDDYWTVVNDLYNNTDVLGNKSPLVSDRFLAIVDKYRHVIHSLLVYDRDYDIDYFGFKTLEKSYLLRLSSGKIVERPQHLFLRVAIGIHWDDWESVERTYNHLSLKEISHATPTLFNAGTPSPSLSSCFLLTCEDSLEGMMHAASSCAKISKSCGGIGLSLHDIRCKGAYIRGTNGTSDGILPYLRTMNALMRQFNQGSKRFGSCAIYLETHHADILQFLEAKKNQGVEEERARDLFYALWVSDLFMKAVQKDNWWYLMNPDVCKDLSDVYGEEYNKLYFSYVTKGMFVKKIKARDLFAKIIESQVETGLPYMSYKDAVNLKSNQKNLGTIRSSNLCNEINIYSSPSEHGTCNLASICLSKCVTESPSLLGYTFPTEFYRFEVLVAPDCVYCKLLKGFLQKSGASFRIIDRNLSEEYRRLLGLPEFKTYPQVFSVNSTHFSTVESLREEVPSDLLLEHIGGYAETWKRFGPTMNFTKLETLAYSATVNVDRVIDETFYPTEESRKSNLAHRPIGIGVQGLADVFFMLKIPFTSREAMSLNKEIFETLYYGAMSASIDLATAKGPYSSFEGSPLSKGILQFNMWGLRDEDLSGRHNWQAIREEVVTHGARNSLLVALMPTASTSQIFGNFEAFEPLTSNIYTRRTLAGNFSVVNKYLIEDLESLGIWNPDTTDRIIYNNGSVQRIKALPSFLREVYKTVWELDQKELVRMSADRGPFVCQSQSLNLYVDKPDFNTLLNIHFLGWRLGLKTGSYYIRSKPAQNAQKFSLDVLLENKLKEEERKKEDDDEGCTACSA